MSMVTAIASKKVIFLKFKPTAELRRLFLRRFMLGVNVKKGLLGATKRGQDNKNNVREAFPRNLAVNKFGPRCNVVNLKKKTKRGRRAGRGRWRPKYLRERYAALVHTRDRLTREALPEFNFFDEYDRRALFTLDSYRLGYPFGARGRRGIDTLFGLWYAAKSPFSSRLKKKAIEKRVRAIEKKISKYSSNYLPDFYRTPTDGTKYLPLRSMLLRKVERKLLGSDYFLMSSSRFKNLYRGLRLVIAREKEFGGGILNKLDESDEGASSNDAYVFNKLAYGRNAAKFKLLIYGDASRKIVSRGRSEPQRRLNRRGRPVVKKIVTFETIKKSKFFYNIFLLRFTLELAFRSSSFFVSFVKRKMKSRLRKAGLAGKDLIKAIRATRGASLPASAELASAAMFSARADSPFIGARHVAWAKKILDFYLPSYQGFSGTSSCSKYLHHPVPSAFKAHIFSKRVFWGGEHASIGGWPKFYYRWGEYAYQAIVWSDIDRERAIWAYTTQLREAPAKTSGFITFKKLRDARQAVKNLALTNEGMPTWKMPSWPAKWAERVVTVWDPRVRRLVPKRFLYAPLTGPLDSIAPAGSLVDLRKVPASSKKLKIFSKLLASGFLRYFVPKIEENFGSVRPIFTHEQAARLYREIFCGVREFLGSYHASYKDVTHDVSLTLHTFVKSRTSFEPHSRPAFSGIKKNNTNIDERKGRLRGRPNFTRGTRQFMPRANFNRQVPFINKSPFSGAVKQKIAIPRAQRAPRSHNTGHRSTRPAPFRASIRAFSSAPYTHIPRSTGRSCSSPLKKLTPSPKSKYDISKKRIWRFIQPSGKFLSSFGGRFKSDPVSAKAGIPRRAFARSGILFAPRYWGQSAKYVKNQRNLDNEEYFESTPGYLKSAEASAVYAGKRFSILDDTVRWADAARMVNLSLGEWAAKRWANRPGILTALNVPYNGNFPAAKVMADLDFIPRRSISINELSLANFTTYLSCNKAAFLKFFATMMRGDETGRFRVTPSGAAAVFDEAIFAARAFDLLKSRRARGAILAGRAPIERHAPFSYSGALKKNIYLSQKNYHNRRPFFLSERVFKKEVAQAWRQLNLVDGKVATLHSTAPDQFREVIRSIMNSVAFELINKHETRNPSTLMNHFRAVYNNKIRLYAEVLKVFSANSALVIRKLSTSVYFNRPLVDVRQLFAFVHNKNLLLRRPMSDKFKFLYTRYIFDNIYIRRARDYLLSSSKSLSSSASNDYIGRALRGIPVHKKHKFLFKINPDIKGRSRVFYYVQKKTWPMRKWNKRYTLLRFYLPPLNLRSGDRSRIASNKFLLDRFAHKVDGTRKFLKLKFFLRHSMRRHYNFSTSNLLSRWKKIKKNKRKWAAYYRLMESGLANYIWICGLIQTRKQARAAIEHGIIYVNAQICLNPDYRVCKGDIITMNSESFWELAQTRVSRIFKRTLARSDAPNEVKRSLMKQTLHLLQRRSQFGVAAAVKSSSEIRTLAKASEMFSHDPVPGDAAYARHMAKARAPGGTQFSKYDVYNASLSHFTASVALHAGSASAARKLVERMFRRWDTSTNYSGGFFYRYYNALYVIRDPASAKELFSVSRRKMDDLYNPWAIKMFYSHSFWR